MTRKDVGLNWRRKPGDADEHSVEPKMWNDY